jgi:RNA polymerase sigma factor (sigma-70 family)
MGSDPAEDLQLLERWRAGDRRAGNELVRKFHTQVLKFFKTAVGDDEPPDLVQETFERLTIAKDAFRGEASARTYVLAIARRVLVDHMRKRYRGSTGFDPLTHTVEDVQGVTPSKVVAELRRTHRLLACLRALPVDTKQMLELYYWQGLTAEELGKVFAEPEGPGIPAGTIRRRIHYAKQKLRECLDAGGPAEVDLDDGLRALGKLLAVGPSGV